jgi:hypothetical protein
LNVFDASFDTSDTSELIFTYQKLSSVQKKHIYHIVFLSGEYWAQYDMMIYGGILFSPSLVDLATLNNYITRATKDSNCKKQGLLKVNF